MNEQISKVERPPVIFLAHPVAGMASPEFQEFAKQLVQAIGRMTRRSVKAVWNGLVRGFRNLDRKWTEAGAMDQRVRAGLDSHYSRKYPMIRGLL